VRIPRRTEMDGCKMVVEKGMFCGKPVASGEKFCSDHGGKSAAAAPKPAPPAEHPDVQKKK
jgi:hypothetical protein